MYSQFYLYMLITVAVYFGTAETTTQLYYFMYKEL